MEPLEKRRRIFQELRQMYQYVDPLAELLAGWAVIPLALVVIVNLKYPNGYLKPLLDSILGLLLSIEAAFIFYFFVEVGRRYRDIKAFRPVVAENIIQIRNCIFEIDWNIQRLFGNEEITADWEFNPDLFEQRVIQLDLNQRIPFVTDLKSKPIRIIEFLGSNVQSIKAAISNLKNLTPILGGEAASIITKMDSDLIFQWTQQSLQYGFRAGIGSAGVFGEILEIFHANFLELNKWAMSVGIINKKLS